jgi:hypothetical protein
MKYDVVTVMKIPRCYRGLEADSAASAIAIVEAAHENDKLHEITEFEDDGECEDEELLYLDVSDGDFESIEGWEPVHAWPAYRSLTKITTAKTTRRNCWSCRWGRNGHHCDALTLDEDIDLPIITWLQEAPMADDGSVPETSDGCPGWNERANNGDAP